jgi:hypothetical protein
LISPGGRFNEESTWAWDTFAWTRKPLLNQSQLETWSGAGKDAPPPPHLNYYLFSSSGADFVLPVSTVRLSHLVLGTSGVLLLLGLSILYFPIARHPLLLLAVALSFAAMAMLQPEMAMVSAQAAALGLLLLGVATWLMRSTSRRPGRFAMHSQPVPGAMIDRGSTKTHYRPTSLTGSHTTAMASAPVAAQLAGPESEP